MSLRSMIGAALLAVAAAGTVDFADAAPLHFGLAKSVPAKDTAVESPSAVQLWFTEVPDEGTTSIRLVGPDDEAVHVGDVVQNGEDAKAFSVAVHGTLAPGSYTVAWRAMGADGHVVRDTFPFSVVAR